MVWVAEGAGRESRGPAITALQPVFKALMFPGSQTRQTTLWTGYCHLCPHRKDSAAQSVGPRAPGDMVTEWSEDVNLTSRFFLLAATLMPYPGPADSDLSGSALALK